MNSNHPPSSKNRTTTAATDYPRYATIVDLVSQQARRAPDSIAVESSRKTLTYAELDEESGRLAGYLRSHGVKNGDFVAVAVERNCNQIVALLATLKAGAAYVPMDTGNPPARSAFILEDADVKLAITDESSGNAIPDFDGRVLFIDREYDAIAGTDTYSSQSSGPLDAAYLNYTSGSTGTPKGVVIPHRAVTRLVCNTDYLQLATGDRVLQGANIAFDAATFEIWGALINGATIVTVPRETTLSPSAYAAYLRARRIDALFVTTALFNQVAREVPDAFAPLGAVLFGGEAVDPRAVARVLEAGAPRRLLHVYGPTEGTTFSSWYEVEAVAPDAETVPIGYPVANTTLHVLDESRQPVPVGETGELYVGGDGLALGYWRRAELTEERFVHDPFAADAGARLYRTGDRVRRSADGAIEFLGRYDHQVKVRGFRIELDEIASALLRQSAVGEAVVLCREDEPGGKRVVAYLTPSEAGRRPTPREMRDALAEELPEYMLPSAFVVLETLPSNRMGKIDRSALPVPDRSATTTEAELVAPSTPVEAQLVEIYAELFGVDAVSPADNFFDLGGYSLLATRIVGRIQEVLGVTLPIEAVFTQPVVSAQASQIEELRARGGEEIGDPIVPVPRDQPIPLALSQERVLFLQELDASSLAYHFQGTIRFRGRLDVEALERALTEIVARHESFRTTFESREGASEQVVHEPWGVRLAVEDLSGLGESEREARLSAYLLELFRMPFVLERLPLVRWSLVRLAAEEHVLTHAEHHIIHDGWSYNVFLAELTALYRAYTRGEASPLPAPTLQFGDFAHWQQRWIQGPEARRQLEYWTEQLAGSPPLSSFPTDRPRPAAQDFQGNAIRVRIPAPLHADLIELARREEVTLFNTMLAALGILLARYSREEEVNIGVGIANRRWRETENLIGMIINNVVIRSQLPGGESVASVLRATRDTMLEASANQDVPFDRVVDAVAPNRTLSHNPLFQILISIHDAPIGDLELPDLRGELELGINVGSAKFDMVLTLIPSVAETIGTSGPRDPGELTIIWEYATALYDRETVERIFVHYRRVLEAMVADPEQSVASLPLLSSKDRGHLIEGLNATARDYGQPATLMSLFEAQVARTPGRPAVRFGERELTYTDLDIAANRLAHRLRRSGVGREVIVAMFMERSIELMVALYAIEKAGGAYLPIDPEYPPERVGFMLEDSRAPVVLTMRDHRERLADFQGEVLCLDVLSDELESLSVEPPKDPPRPDDLAYVIYTSGSTGRPKGVMNTHAGICNRLLWMQETFALEPDDRVVQKTPYGFDVSIWELFWPLQTGAVLVVAPPAIHRDPVALVTLFDRDRITTAHFVPSMLQFFLDEPEVGRCTKLSRIVCSGEALPFELQERCLTRLPLASLHNLYGPTEAAVDVTHWVCKRDSRHRVVPIGRPVANTELYVVDQWGGLTPQGVPGELCIGGVQVARGYLNRPELTAERFVQDRFSGRSGTRLYRTGDLVRYDADGNLLFLGRLDHQVKLRGERIELGEIEARLDEHPGVEQSVVVVKELATGRPQLVAYVTAAGEATSTELLRTHLAEKLPRHMVPSMVQVLDRFPLTASGKVNRGALPAPRMAESSQSDAATPRNDTERRLADIWQAVLGLETVGIHDNFFELGGDSIQGMQVVSRANQVGIALTMKDLFQRQTVADLAAHAETTAVVVETPEAAAQIPTGPLPLTPIQHWFFDQDLRNVDHWNQSLLLEVRVGVDTEALTQAVRVVLSRHDALRLRWYEGEPGEWTCIDGGSAAEVPVEREDFSRFPEDERASALERAARTVQSGLDISDGPTCRAMLFEHGPACAGRLLIVIHHLAVDGVSWRILMDEIQIAYQQIADGNVVDLSPVPTSFGRWAHEVAASARDEGLAHELSYWADQDWSKCAPLPVDLSSKANSEASARTCTIQLTESETHQLLREVPAAYQTQINDILLSALVRTMASWVDGAALLVGMEGHGRELQGTHTDVSRTVGWFTSIFPLLLDLEETDDIGALLTRTREALRGVPNRGVGYGLLRYLGAEETIERLKQIPEPRISFNYYGQFDQSLPKSSPFDRAAESVGPNHGRSNARKHLLDVYGRVQGGRLEVHWTYSEKIHRTETIERVANDFLEALRAIISHCSQPDDPDPSSPDGSKRTRGGSVPEASVTPEHLVEDRYPLSPMQQGMLYHSQLTPDRGAYHEQWVITIESGFDAAGFEWAWRKVIQRHAILRTAFIQEGSGLHGQVVFRAARLPLSMHDWRDLTQAEQGGRLAALLEADLEQGFDVSQPPLMRLAVVRLDDDRHELVWSFHHCLLDGPSLHRIAEDLFGYLEAHEQGEDLRKEPPPPYRDYIDWLQGQEDSCAEDFWRERLKGFENPTRIMGDRPSAAARGDVHRERRTELSTEATNAVKEFARRNRLTVNTLLRAAWALLLSRYSNENDVVLGAVTSIRPPELPEADHMVGLMINTIAVRVRLEEGATVAAWLGGLQAEQAEESQFAHCSLVDVAGWSEVGRHSPLFESLFVFENYRPGVSLVGRHGRLEISELRNLERTSYPLTVILGLGERLRFRIGYDSALFDDDTIERMLGHYGNVLEALVQSADRCVREVSLLGSAEWSQVVEEWNRTERVLDTPETLHELVTAQARRTPNAVAIDCRGTRLTYGELDARADAVASELVALGVRPEVMVGLCTRRTADMLVGMLGILKAGGAYVPLDPAYPASRLEFMLEDTAAPVVLTSTDLTDRFESYGGRLVTLDTFDYRSARTNTGEIQAPADGTGLAYIIYTSGSTGRPKGVAIEHRNAVALIAWAQHVFGPTECAGMLASTSISFDLSVFEIFLPLSQGGTVILADNALELRTLPSKESVTLVNSVPSVMAEVLNQGPLPGSVVTVNLAGEPLPASLVNRLYDEASVERVYDLYAPSETTTYSTYTLRERTGSVTIGRPIANTRAYVLDAGSRPVPIGVPGELYLGGAGVARGYLNRPELTKERFIPSMFRAGDRLYRTGDLVRYRADGKLEYLGRADHQVKLRGHRIELGEIETRLDQHPDIDQSVVVVKQLAGGQPQLVAYVVTQDIRPSPETLQAHLGESLPKHMVPGVYQFLDRFPVTPNGKIDRRALPDPGTRSVQSVAPRSGLERRIAQIWREVLQLSDVGVRDNFFDLGGHSIRLMEMHQRLKEEFDCDLSVVDLFQHTTIESIAVRLGGETGTESLLDRAAEQRARRPSGKDAAIAVLAVNGRFPGASSVDRLWENLRAGVESITFSSPDTLREAGVSDELLGNPDFVPASVALDGADRFDARFFGYAPREAELIDPQQRIFLECAWEALEDAGYDPRRCSEVIGVWAGVDQNGYLANLRTHPQLLAEAGANQVLLSSDKDFLCTRVSYKLDLKGPSVNVQTACSTSLVAVHEACEALQAGRCDVALAGGVSLPQTSNLGYVYQPGGIRSPDGHCRAFDAQARGTIPGAGVGVVVLKRLEEALRDGDQIAAVIRGSATNNDGSRKVGFTAPSIEGQAEVIAMAHTAAGFDAESITYVEAHGTGTTLGDPIEAAALQRVFGERTARRHFCALGSLKTNIGHLNSTAGVAGLIKTVLALQHREIPPSLHYEAPNPEIDFDSSAFFVNTELRPWEPPPGTPRRAGVSSFGLGGTNAHVVVEEAPERPASTPASRQLQILPLSARTPTALARMAERLADHLRRCPNLPLADVAYTLQTGRAEMSNRRALVVPNVTDAVAGLADMAGMDAIAAATTDQETEAVFLFPGQGTQHVDMGRDLYQRERVYRETVDRCCEILAPELSCDLREILHPADGVSVAASERLTHTAWAQPALFVVEYALSAQWRHWGVEPAACLGHSVGELVAACVSGVFGLEDALRLTALRGRLMESMPPGVMTAVTLSADAVAERLGQDDGLWLSAVNGPELCVVSGDAARVERWEAELAAEGVTCKRLHTSHAFHSGHMEDAVAPFVEAVAAVPLGRPNIPFVSNVSGDWITVEEACDPHYWGRHIRETVLFDRGLACLLTDDKRALLEVGPGRVLTTLARLQPGSHVQRLAVTSFRAADRAGDDVAVLLEGLGHLWAGGVRVDWSAVHDGEQRQRVRLPTYPFDRERYYIEPAAATSHPAPSRAALADWSYLPAWQPSMRPVSKDSSSKAETESWLVLTGEGAFARSVVEGLKAEGHAVTEVAARIEGFVKADGRLVDPRSRDDFTRLFRELDAVGRFPDRIVHLWCATPDQGRDDTAARRTGALAFDALLCLAQGMDDAGASRPVRLDVVSVGLPGPDGNEVLHPEKALLLGPCRVMGVEFPHVTCRVVDVSVGDVRERPAETCDRVLEELTADGDEPRVAYRRGRRYVESFAPAPLVALPDDTLPRRLRHGGTYLVTGGLGGMGLELASYLASGPGANLVLTSRAGLPSRATWPTHLAENGPEDAVSRRILGVQRLESAGATVEIGVADVTDADAMRVVVSDAVERFGRIDGVIHAAGVPGEGVMVLKDHATAAAVLAPKVTGTRVLESLFADTGLDFLLLCSSISAVLRLGGQTDYCAANSYLDAFARDFSSRTGIFTVSVNWNRWIESGMAVEYASKTGRRISLENGCSNREGIEIFQRILHSCTEPQIVISETDLMARIAEASSAPAGDSASNTTDSGQSSADSSAGGHARPDLDSSFAGAETATQLAVVSVWERLLGIDGIGIDDDFYNLGGHSLVVLQVVSRLTEQLGVHLTMRSALKLPTVRSLSEEIDRLLTPGAESGDGAADSSATMEEGTI